MTTRTINGRVYRVQPNRVARLCALLAVLAGSLTDAWSGEWPEYRGPEGDGRSPEKISTVWPAQGPRVIWKTPTPNGFSSFAVSNGRAYTQVTRTIEGVDWEVCLALDAVSGKELWAAPVGVVGYGHEGGNRGAPGNQGGDGPRSTPSVDGDRVYVLSSDLLLVSFDARTGKLIWSKNLVKEHRARNIGWKNAASPLIDGDLIFVCAGGRGESLLAIRKSDGSTVWKGQDDAMTHATPVAASIHGIRQVIFLTQKGLVSVAPETGKPFWRYSFPYQTSTAASPVVAGDIVYCSAGYGVGAAAVQIVRSGDSFEAQELWRKRGEPLANHWSTPVFHNGHLYGLFGFRAYGTAPLKCIELATGREVWAEPGFGQGNVILAENTLIVLGDAGQLVLVEPTPERYKETARIDLLEGKCWSTPALSDGRLYVRSTKEGACVDAVVQSAGIGAGREASGARSQADN